MSLCVVIIAVFIYFARNKKKKKKSLPRSGFVSPLNPARVGCQLLFALRRGATVAPFGADERVWHRPTAAGERRTGENTRLVRDHDTAIVRVGICDTQLVRTCDATLPSHLQKKKTHLVIKARVWILTVTVC